MKRESFVKFFGRIASIGIDSFSLVVSYSTFVVAYSNSLIKSSSKFSCSVNPAAALWPPEFITKWEGIIDISVFELILLFDLIDPLIMLSCFVKKIATF